MSTAITPVRQSMVIGHWLPDQITNGDGKGRWKAIKARKASKVMAWACARQAGWQFVPGRVRLSIVFVFPVKRKRDIDNLYGRAIGLINGLKGDYFTDDESDCLEPVVRALVEPGVRETRITIEPIDAQAANEGSRGVNGLD